MSPLLRHAESSNRLPEGGSHTFHEEPCKDMKKFRYQVVDVFTSYAFGGNQLAVFTEALGLTSQVMQRIAKELNLAETTFVLPPDDPHHDYRIRIFTPAVELPMAGHPTIGTAFVLAREHVAERTSRPTVLNLEEGVGPIVVTIKWHEDSPAEIQMGQPLPVFGARFPDAKVIAKMLSVEPRAITETGLPMEVVSCGVPFLFVPMRSLQDVRSIQFRHDVWEQALRGFEAPQVFVFTQETETNEANVHCRMFAPALGISEDAATGGASGPLGCYLLHHRLIAADTRGEADCLSEQGFEMGRPSFIRIKITQDGDAISRVQVGGQCYLMGEGQLFLDV
jgi:trans-2,3-dihydro-3-hydroxyanthranilate isomerase